MMEKSMNLDPNLLFERRGFLGIVTLNRPEALNALTLGMIQGIRRILKECRDDDAIQAILFKGAGDRAFCSGGDVKAVYQAGIGVSDPDEKIALARVYFADEYRMNRELFHYPKILAAYMDGITMGGGFGVAGPCRYRIATPRTIFAMPEVGIGFFPDVGSMHALTRCPGRIGHYLALTGNKISGEDMFASGLATHFAAQEFFDDIVNNFNIFIEKHHSKYEKKNETLRDVHEIINYAFSFSKIENILDVLDKMNHPFAKETAAVMRGRCPTSVKLAHAYYDKMAGQDFDTVTAMDYRLAMHCMLGHEFYEGIRAALIDKDRSPKWNPARIEDVSDDVIANYFHWDKISLSKPISDL
ncbi:MAG TPA: enoyl-CoA hydratase/isomerase family protein [Micavibrio sp.]